MPRGFGAGFLADLVGLKKANEVWFLCQRYVAEQAREGREAYKGNVARSENFPDVHNPNVPRSW